MVKIWGRISSINVRKCIWTVQELGISFERIDAGQHFGIVKTPEFMAKNPNALIPLLEDGDVVLWESNVIVRYLCAQYAAGTLYPLALPARFDAERWMDWQQTTFNPAGRDAFMQLIRTPVQERKQNLIDASNAATERLLTMLNAHLASRRFVMGDQFTMADIPLGCEAHRWYGLTQPRQTHAHVERWFADLAARPAARGVLDLQLS
jgi:glutathione S-transferase